MEQSEVIRILKNRDMMLLDCAERKRDSLRELQRVEGVAHLKHLYETSVQHIEEEEEIINFVWFHFLRLPAEEHALLNELYVKQTGWEYVMQTFRMSKATVSRKKNKAIEKLIAELSKKEEDI